MFKSLWVLNWYVWSVSPSIPTSRRFQWDIFDAELSADQKELLLSVRVDFRGQLKDGDTFKRLIVLILNDLWRQTTVVFRIC